jgi:hypothetical protein
MKKLNEEILKKFNMLCEYNIKEGVKVEKPITEEDNDLPPTDDDIETTTTTDKTTTVGKSTLEPMVDNKPIEFENTEEVEKLQKEEDLAKKSDIDRVKEIQDMQTKKLEEFENYIKELGNDIEDVKLRTIDIDNIKTNVDILHQQVEDITPATPEQSLENMAKISGGITVEDYWRNYFNENKPYKRIADDNTEEIIKLEKEKEIKDIVNNNMSLSDSEVKDSISKF